MIPVEGSEFLEGDENWDEFTLSATLSYIASDNMLEQLNLDSLLVYTTYSEGFKAGGFVVLDGETVSFEPEAVTNYEFGIKLDSLDNRLRFNAAVYSMEYDDMQITVTRQIAEIGTAVAIANAGKAAMRGVEAEITFLPTVNWFFQLSANYIDAEYDEFTDIVRDPGTGLFVPIDRSDEPFAYLPETTYSIVGQYSRDTDWGEFSGRLSGFYIDEIYIGLEGGADVSAFDTLEDYTLWNARFTWRSVSDLDLEVALYVDNLADKDYFGTGNLQYAAQGSLTLVKGVERTYGAQAVFRF